MIAAVSDGRDGTAMRPFRDLLSPDDIALVVDFVRDSFMRCRDNPTRYHTEENGWPAHRARYGAAYPFVLGARSAREAIEPAASPPPGLVLFRENCSICHDPVATDVANAGRISNDAPPQFQGHWKIPLKPGTTLPHAGDEAEEEGAAYGTYDHTRPTKHDIPPTLPHMTSLEARGKTLYERVCAYCHAADGSGKNWIGSFLEPHPTDFNAFPDGKAPTDEALRQAILEGVPLSSMPAFRSALSDKDVAAIIAYLRRAFMDREESRQKPNRPR